MITERERQAREGSRINSSLRQVQDFEESTFFSDFVVYIENQIISLQLELEQAQTLPEMFKLQGGLRALREVLDLPLRMKEAIIEEQEQDNGERN